MKLFLLTAACGVGKSTIKDAIQTRRLLPGFACIDTDEVGVNWWDYGMARKNQFHDACLMEAVRQAHGRHLLFSTCMNPADFYETIHLPEEITSTCLMAMTCSDAELTRRLKARPPERMCGDDAFIQAQIDYLHWYRKNRGKFQFFLDNTGMTISDTADSVAAFIRGQMEGNQCCFPAPKEENR